uniref:Uncharacterized protein n=1 Tax=Chenopodium quinoa TaxID=63459 RepID=A0A803MQA2_CHEQI
MLTKHDSQPSDIFQLQKRSASATRVSDEFSANLVPASDADELPVYREVSKKQSGLQRRFTFPAEYVIHLIPVILVLCGFILWFNSHHTEKI